MIVTSRAASMTPRLAMLAANAAPRPRRSRRAVSNMSTYVPDDSPPTEKPCTRRRSTSAMGAAAPIEACVGSSPITTIAMLIITTE
jgi:hypothetical protein